MDIRVLSAGKEIGPYSESQVRQYLSEGIISSSDLALYEGLTEWQPIEQVLASLPAAENSQESIGADATQSVTVRATAAQRTKRGPIVLQPMFSAEGGESPKRSRTGKTALTIEAPRPTTQLPPVAKFILKDEKKAPRGTISTEALAPANFFAVPANETTEDATVPAQEEASDIFTGEESQPATDVAPHESEAQSHPLPNAILYTGIVVGLLALLFIAIVVYLFWHFSTPAPRSAPPAPTAPATTTIEIPTNPQTSGDYSDRGYARQVKGDLDGALADFDQAISLDPRNNQAVYRRAVARQTKGDWDGALSDYNVLLTLKPDDADAFSNRGFVKQTKGDLDGALADYSAALTRDPKIAVAYYNIGLIKVRRGDLDGGIEAYNLALDINPKLTRAYYNRGKAKSAEGNIDGAIADYTQALNLDPSVATAHLERGVARQSKGDTNGAMDDYTQAIVHDPNLGPAYYNRGYIELLRGDLAATVTDSTQAITLDRNDAKAFFNRGMAELGQNNTDNAEADFAKYCQLSPNDPDSDCARLYLWIIAALQNARDKADDDLAYAVQNTWNSSPEDLTSKIAAFLLGHIHEDELIADAASPDPSREPGRRCRVWYFAGMKRLAMGDYANAENYFQKSVATNQKNFCEFLFARTQLVALGQSRQASAQTPASIPPQ